MVSKANRCPATNTTGNSIEARNRNMTVQCEKEKDHANKPPMYSSTHYWHRGRDRMYWGG